MKCCFIQTIWARGCNRQAVQIGTDDVSPQRTVPYISDIPTKQRVGLPPVGAVIVEHLVRRKLAAAKAMARAPGRIIVVPIRRIGDHHIRLRSRQHRLDIHRVSAVTAADPVVAQLPYVTRPSDRLLGYFRDAVGIRQTARPQDVQNGLKPIRFEAEQVEVEAGEAERLQFGP